MGDPKPKQQWQVQEQKRNWLELPNDVTSNILHRIGAFDILQNAQKVCTTWRKICKDPSMWRVIYIDVNDYYCRLMCMYAVLHSQGQLVDITIVGSPNDELLQFVADRSSQLKRLGIISLNYKFRGNWTRALKKFPMLEELNLCKIENAKEVIEAAARCCPMLKTLKVNREGCLIYDHGRPDDKTALAIGENLPGLKHLELIANNMTNIGLQAILDGCNNLESLDLCRCSEIDLTGDMGKKCSEKIKCLKLPNDYLYGFPYSRLINEDLTCERCADELAYFAL